MKYAQYDPASQASPAPVVGWFHVGDQDDPGGLEYTTLPATLAPVPEDIWADTDGRVNGAYGVTDGKVVLLPPPSAEEVAVHEAADARAAGRAAMQRILDAGVQVAFASSPALNAVYTVVEPAERRISAIYAGIKGGDGLPGGGGTFAYEDKAGTDHDFSEAQFLAFAKAVRDYIYAVTQAAKSGAAWPSSTLTIK